MITKLGAEMVGEAKAGEGGALTAGLLGGVGSSVGASLGTGILVRPAMPALKKIIRRSGDLSPRETAQLLKSFKVRNIKMKSIYQSPLGNLAGPHFNPITREVVANKDSYVLAHELGHATGLLGSKSRLVTALGLAAYNLGGPIVAPVIRGVNSTLRARNKALGLPDEENSKGWQAASRVTQAATGLQLAEEAQATLRGLAHIRKVQGAPGMWRAAGALTPAFATYVAAALGSHAAAPYVGGRIGRYLGEREAALAKATP